MQKIGIGDKVPSFPFVCTHSHIKSFQDLKGKNIVLYFYPKDNTPGCTIEGKDFGASHAQFEKLNTVILGVSRDSLPCHEKFAKKLTLPFGLISDPEEKLCQYFNVIIEKNMFKKLFLGIERSTFLIDTKGVIRHIWRNVKVKGHVNEVYQALSEI